MFRSLALAAALSLVACDDATEGKPVATVQEAAPAAPTPPPAAAEPAAAAPAAMAIPEGATPLAGDSTIEWIGAKVTKSHPGGFKVLDGWAQVDGEQISRAQVVIDLDSTFSDSEKLTKHLKDPDFFDVGTFPKATFDITAITAGGADGASHTVTGTLDFHGVKKEIGFPATVTMAEGAATIAAEFVLNRQDFGISYPGRKDDLIKDEVLVKGQLRFKG